MSSLPDEVADIPYNLVVLSVISKQVLVINEQQKKLDAKVTALTLQVEKLLALQTATTVSTPSGGT